jgi:hypothetical protein
MNEQRGICRLESYDDGSEVWLNSYSGGGSAEGAWGRIRLAFYAPDGSLVTVSYRTE